MLSKLAEEALRDYLNSPLVRHDTSRLLIRQFGMRANVSAADAAYVALCESLDATLLTLDHRLERAVREHIRTIEVNPPGLRL